MNRRQIPAFFILLLLLVLPTLSGCGRTSHNVPEELSDASIYSEDSAMAIFVRNPDRALTLLDSAVLVGNLSPARHQYLEAMVWYNGKLRPDTCITLCQQLLEKRPWSGNFDVHDPVIFETIIYSLMATAAFTEEDYPLIIDCAQKGVALAHGREDLKAEESDLTSRYGYALCEMGQIDAGLAAYRRADSLIAGKDSWECLITYSNISKRNIATLKEIGRYDEAESAAHNVIARMDRLMTDPSRFEGIPSGMLADSTTLRSFVDYSLLPVYSYLSDIALSQGNTEESQHWVDLFLNSPLSDKHLESLNIIRSMIQLGRIQEARQRLAEIHADYQTGRDTLTRKYQELIEQEAFANAASNDYKSAYLLECLAKVIEDSVEIQEDEQKLHQLATRFKLQEEQLLRQKAESRVRFWYTIAVASTALVLLLIALFRWHDVRRKYHESKQELEKTSQALDEAHGRIKQLQIDIIESGEPSNVSEKEIYRRCLLLMSDSHCYEDTELSLDTMAKRVFTNRTYLSNAITHFTGLNFRSWLASYRIERAKEILEKNPEVTIDELSAHVGFESRSTFYRQFQNITGQTIREYIESIDKAGTK